MNKAEIRNCGVCAFMNACAAEYNLFLLLFFSVPYTDITPTSITDPNIDSFSTNEGNESIWVFMKTPLI